MAPRPEYEHSGVLYSSPSEDECAQLVKPGQLDTFNTKRNEQLLERLKAQTRADSNADTNSNGHSPPSSFTSTNSDDFRGRSRTKSLNPALRKSKSCPRNTQTNILQIGDRVLVKGKYLGFCKYIGPILEDYLPRDLLGEVFVGVQLDELLTNNSGIFGSRQYFECPHGFGLMVTSDKVSKLDQMYSELEAAKPPSEHTASIHSGAASQDQNSIGSAGSLQSEQSRGRKTKEMSMSERKKRSKSVADISRMIKSTNWMDDRPVKVSTGWKSLNRSQSISNLDQQAFLRAESDPREVLNQVKKMQPSFGYGTYPAQVVNPYQFGSETAAFGVPRSVSQHHQSEKSPFTWEADNNLLRQSFARIVSTTSAPTGQFYNQAPPVMYTKPSFSGSLPVGAFQHHEEFSSDSEAGLTRMYSAPLRAQSFTDYRAFQQQQQLLQFQQQQKLQQQQQLEAQRLQQQKQLQKQQIQQQQQQRPPQQFCATCAACKSCAPLRQNFNNSAFQNTNVFDPLGLSYNFAPPAPSNLPARSFTPPTSLQNSQTLPRTVSERQTMPASVLKKYSTLPASSGLTSKEKLLQEFDRRRQQQFDTMSMTSTQSASIEYEKWKQRHGITTGRQMKKGLSKLQYAFDY
jgi:hypothetical protein